jgi:hypothetical protein
VGSFTQSTESANIEINVVPRLFRATLRRKTLESAR